MERYALLERDYPTHRLADDARLRGAHAALDAGDEPRFVRMLETIADAYPEGDVSNDGLFELALFHFDKQDWAGAVARLEKALARAPRERAYWASGRLPYFLARAHLETGAAARASPSSPASIRDYPLTYYMALAHARLADRDRGAAESALAEAAAREPEGAVHRHARPLARRSRLRPRPGAAPPGRRQAGPRELDRLGFTARTAPREVLWTAAFLLARPGGLHPVPLHPARAAEHGPPPRQRPHRLARALPRRPLARRLGDGLPPPLRALVADAAPRQSLPEAWAYAIMREESAFDARVVSRAQAIGLMQLIVPTAQKMGEKLGIAPDEESLKQPAVNIPLGCHYLAVLRGQFADNPLLAIPGYNAGAGAPKKWISKHPADDFDLWVERIPYEETRNYTKRVIGTMAAYEFLYFRDQPSEALRAPLAASPRARGGVAAPAP